jgi:pimeloyl-ACP methyl ester carboxylesterase
MRHVVAALSALALWLCAAGAGAGEAPAAAPRLSNPRPCPEARGFTCSTLRVPLDRSGRLRGTLDLNVAVADNRDAPRGVLLFLTGGPGQPGVPSVPRISQRLVSLMDDFRLVMIDQRGTGGTAIVCPALQQQVGSSDITVPTRGAVTDCARRVGARRGLYATRDTVADLDALRQALRASTWTLDGVSYGTFTAERYALAHPKAVKALVLDSVLPHVDSQADDALYLTGLRATARVLRASCADLGCGYDPASELNWLVRQRGEGVALFDAIVAYEFVDPTYRVVLDAIHAARQGDRSALDDLIAATRLFSVAPTERFSSGLHAATLCSDMRFPWDGAATATHAQRRRSLERRIRSLPARAVWPFDRATAAGNGFITTCLNWPATTVPPFPRADSKLPPVPTLLLNGDRDLSTPLEWAREEARRAPRGKLVVVPGASHSVQSRERGDLGRRAVEAFLLGG